MHAIAQNLNSEKPQNLSVYIRPYTKFDNVLIGHFQEKKLSLEAIGVFTALGLAINSRDTNASSISQDYLCKICSCSKRVISRSIKELQEKGFVEIIKVAGSRANQYNLNGIFRGKKENISSTTVVPLCGTNVVPPHVRGYSNSFKKNTKQELQQGVVVDFIQNPKEKIMLGKNSPLKEISENQLLALKEEFGFKRLQAKVNLLELQYRKPAARKKIENWISLLRYFLQNDIKPTEKQSKGLDWTGGDKEATRQVQQEKYEEVESNESPIEYESNTEKYKAIAKRVDEQIWDTIQNEYDQSQQNELFEIAKEIIGEGVDQYSRQRVLLLGYKRIYENKVQKLYEELDR
jgi:hypothetical protein